MLSNSFTDNIAVKFEKALNILFNFLSIEFKQINLFFDSLNPRNKYIRSRKF